MATVDVPRFKARRRRQPRSRVRKAWKPALAVFVLAVAVGAGISIRGTVVTAQADMFAARDELLSGARVLQANGLNVTRPQLVSTRADFERAEGHFLHARAAIARNPLISLVGAIPPAGVQVRSAEAFADMGIHLARAGKLADDALSGLLTRGLVGSSSVRQSPSERLVALLRSLDSQLPAIESEINATQRARAEIPSRGLLPQLGQATRLFDSKFASVADGITTLQAAEPSLYSLLGIDGPSSYLVLQQDPAELRGSGGFIGTVGFLRFAGGKMAPYDSRNVLEIDNALGKVGNPKYVAPPPPIDSRIHPASWELRDANWSPDFPTTARQTEFFLNRERGQQVGGVIAIDPQLVSSILDVVGPIRVPETGDTVTSGNFYYTSLIRVHVGPGASKSFLSYVAKPLLDRLSNLPSNQWLSMVRVLGRACETRSLQLYFDDPALEGLVDRYHCSGRIQPLTQDGLMIVDSNLNGNKDDYWITRRFDLKIQIRPDGSALHTLHLHYEGLTRHGFLAGEYIDWLRVYVPRSSNLVSAQGAELQQAEDLGRRVIQGWIHFRYLQSADVTIVYDAGAASPHTSDHRLQLLWQKQAGRSADPISVELVLPAGWTLKSAAVDRTFDASASVSTDLSADREFAFQYQPS